MTLAFALSAAAIVALGLLDPKRRRALRGRRGVTWSRRALVVMLLIMGTILAAGGYTAAFVVWIGTVSVAGWLMAYLVNRKVLAGQPSTADDR